MDLHLTVETDLSLESLVDGHMAEVTCAKLLLGNALVTSTASHCVLLILLDTYHLLLLK